MQVARWSLKSRTKLILWATTLLNELSDQLDFAKILESFARFPVFCISMRARAWQKREFYSY